MITVYKFPILAGIIALYRVMLGEEVDTVRAPALKLWRRRA